MISATQAITYRPYGPPPEPEVVVEYEPDDERVDTEQSVESLSSAEKETGHKINIHALKVIKQTGSEAFVQLNDNENGSGGPVDVRIKVISDDDNNGSAIDKE